MRMQTLALGHKGLCLLLSGSEMLLGFPAVSADVAGTQAEGVFTSCAWHEASLVGLFSWAPLGLCLAPMAAQEMGKPTRSTSVIQTLFFSCLLSVLGSAGTTQSKGLGKA